MLLTNGPVRGLQEKMCVRRKMTSPWCHNGHDSSPMVQSEDSRKKCVWDGKWTSLWCHNGHDSVSNHQPHNCWLKPLFRRRWKKTSQLRVTGLCVGNSPGTGEFPAQMAIKAENISIWWRHHGYTDKHTHTQICIWGLQSFLRWWLPSTLWAGPLFFSSTTTRDVWIIPSYQILGCVSCMVSTFNVSSWIVANISESFLLSQ